jgi:hypothetical protein
MKDKIEELIIQMHDCKLDDMFAVLQTPKHLTEEQRTEMLDTYMYTALVPNLDTKTTTISVASGDEDGNLLVGPGYFRASGVYDVKSKSWKIVDEEYYV